MEIEEVWNEVSQTAVAPKATCPSVPAGPAYQTCQLNNLVIYNLFEQSCCISVELLSLHHANACYQPS